MIHASKTDADFQFQQLLELESLLTINQLLAQRTSLNSASKQLAALVTHIQFQDIPRAIVEKTNLHVLDTLSLSASGALRLQSILAPFIRLLSREGLSSIMGLGGRSTPDSAALVNSISAHSTEFDDEHRGSMTHVGSAVVPAALAAAQQARANGRELITSIVLGYEAAIRIGSAMGPKGVYERGFHPSSICGCIGSAVATAKILNLSEAEVANAIGLAAVQCSGMMEGVETGPSSWHFQYGRGSQSGLMAALLAKAGFTSPESILDGQKGLVTIFSNAPNHEPLQASMTGGFAIESVGFKPYACCRSIHPAIDAVAKTLRQHSLNPKSIQKIETRFPRVAFPLVSNPPNISQSTLFLQQSAAFCLASYVHSGQLTLDEFEAQNRSRPQVIELAKKCEVHVDPELDSLTPRLMPARIVVHLDSGEKYEAEEYTPSGDPENPLTTDQIRTKAKSVLRATVLASVFDSFAERILSLENKSAGDVYNLVPF
jgi:2-methylcitrate dehydratase PrpD